MKRLLPCMLVFIVVSAGAQERRTLESIVPSSAGFFAKTAQIRDLVKSAGLFLDTVLSGPQRQKAESALAEFRNKTGVDPLDPESLSGAGIDTEGRIGLAWFGKGRTENSDRIILYIPCRKDGDIAPLFVELMRKSHEGKGEEIRPVSSNYGGKTIVRVKDDLFVTQMEGYLIVASEDGLARSVVDLWNSGAGGSIAADAHYADYLKYAVGEYDISTFARRDFIAEMMKKSGDKNQPAREGGAATEGAGPDVGWIDYGALGVSMAKDRLTAGVSFKYNGSDPKIVALMEAIRPADPKEALGYGDPGIYAVLSVWPDRLDAALAGTERAAKGYGELKQKLLAEWGIDLTRDFFPHAAGLAVMISEKGGGLRPRGVTFMPMKTAKSGGMIRDKIRSHLQSRLAQDQCGDITAGGKKIFWHLDRNRGRNYIAADSRGFFTGSDQELMERAMESKTIALGGPSPMKAVARKDLLFMYLYMNKESFVRPLMMIMAAGFTRDNNLISLLGRMGDATIYGRKNGPLMSFDFELEISAGGR